MRPAKLVLLSSLAAEPYDKSGVFSERSIIAKRLKDISEKFRIVLIIDIVYRSPKGGDNFTGHFWPGGLNALNFVDRAVVRVAGFKERVLKDRGNV